MKKIAIALSALLAVAGITGCGQKNESPEAEPKAPASAKLKIGVSLPAADHGWSGGIISAAELAKKEVEAENADVEVILTIGKDATEQHDKIDNLVARGIDALVVVCQEPGPITPACVRAHDKGVYVVIVSNPMSDPSCQDLFINGDNTNLGEQAARAIGKLIDGKGDILVMEGILCPINTQRVEGFNRVLKEEFPEIKVLESQPAWWDTEKGMNLMETYLGKYKQIDGIWVGDDDVLVGAIKAYENSGRSDIKAMVGGGGSKIVVKRIMDGDPVVRATVTYPPMMAHRGIIEALKGLRNGKKPVDGVKEIVIPSEIVTQENAKNFYYPESLY